MKILFLHCLADPEKGGGAEQTLWTLMRGLKEAGHECVLLATSDSKGLRNFERDQIKVWEAGIRNVYWPYHRERPPASKRLLWHALDSYNPWMQEFLKRVVEEEKPDVASLHNLPGWSAASWTTLSELNVPVVQVLHDYYSACVKATMYGSGGNCASQCVGCKIFRLPHKAKSQNVQAVVGVSHFVLEAHRSLGFFSDVPIQEVIHNARDPDVLGVNSSEPENFRTRLRFGFIGSLLPSKGIELLLRAFKSSNLSNSELWIAGSGKSDYESYLRNLVPDDNVIFMGRVSQKEFYSHVDVVVAPSIWNEPLGMVVAEALAFGKPVIGAQRGGIPEMIKDGENGLLFDPDEKEDLVTCLEGIHDNPDFRNYLADNSKKSIESFVDILSWVVKYIDLYSKVVAKAENEYIRGDT